MTKIEKIINKEIDKWTPLKGIDYDPLFITYCHGARKALFRLKRKLKKK